MIPGIFACQCGLRLTEEQMWDTGCPRCAQFAKRAKALAFLCSLPDCYRPISSKGMCRAHYVKQWRDSK